MLLTSENVQRLRSILLQQDPRLVVLDRIIELNCIGNTAEILWIRLQTLPAVYNRTTWPTQELTMHGVGMPQLSINQHNYGTF